MSVEGGSVYPNYKCFSNMELVLHQTPLLFRYIITRVELLAYHHEEVDHIGRYGLSRTEQRS